MNQKQMFPLKVTISIRLNTLFKFVYAELSTLHDKRIFDSFSEFLKLDARFTGYCDMIMRQFTPC